MDAFYEPHKVVYTSWSADKKAVKWEPSRQYQYLEGSQGGSESNPAACIMDKSSKGKCTIANLFSEYATVKGIFEPMSKFNQYY